MFIPRLFKEFVLNLNNKFIKPTYQGSLDQDKIEQMYNSYLKNPHYLKFKDNIIIGVINNKFYIIDGQHRYQLAIKLFEEKDAITNDKVSYITIHIRKSN